METLEHVCYYAYRFGSRRKMFTMIAVLVVVLGVLAFVVAVYINSSKQPKPFLDKDGQPLAGSISEKVFVEINGVKQGMFIKGKSLSNPVLLYLHGGMPDFFLTQRYPTGLEDHLTVVWWEQRGAGISYSGNIDPKTLNSRQLIEDTKTLSRHLCLRFGREKIYLMGHSGGAFIGLQAAAEAPELFHAYIGVAQMVDQRASEKEAYDHMLLSFEERGDKGMARRLRRAPVPGQGDIPKAYLTVRDKAMHRSGVGTMHQMRSVFSGLFIPSLFFREYSFADKVKLWRAKARSGLERDLGRNTDDGLEPKDRPAGRAVLRLSRVDGLHGLLCPVQSLLRAGAGSRKRLLYLCPLGAQSSIRRASKDDSNHCQ